MINGDAQQGRVICKRDVPGNTKYIFFAHNEYSAFNAGDKV